jgi:RNA polymerase sigma-70 factor (ECF subfamily)
VAVFSRKKKRISDSELLKHVDALYSTALRLARDRHDAQDLVQDPYLKALRFSDTFQPGTNLKAWLFRILFNTFINEYRRRRRSRDLLGRGLGDPAYDGTFSREVARASRDPESEILDRLMPDEVERALDELPAEFRTAIILADVEEFTYKEIAEIIDRPVGTVMSRLFRGRRMLQRSLLDYAVRQGYVASREDAPAGAIPLDPHRRRRPKARSE